jgi:peptidoglycan/LPS O-acetylase OafA/YrhL
VQLTADASARAKARFVGLDLLRLLAIMLVLGRHMLPAPETLPLPLQSVFLTWHRGGWVGVDLFFVLSGFLVSGLLFAEYKSRGQLSTIRFYTRRAWKIYPPFYFLIAVTVLARITLGQPITRRRLLSELLFLQSYVPGLWNHTWSLAVEEHFYLLLPLALTLVAIVNKRSPTPLKPVLALTAIVAVSALALRLLNWKYRPSYSHLTHLYATHLRLDSLAFGVAIAYAYHFHTARFVAVLSGWRRPLVVGGALLLVPAFVFELESTPFIFTAGLTIFYLGSGMILTGVLLSELPRSRIIAALGLLGAYSYSIYLWHMPVATWGVPLVESALGRQFGFGTRAALYVFGSLAVGVVMARLIEYPALRLRDRWFPSRSKGALEVRS